jgi:spore maturation protein CgeB
MRILALRPEGLVIPFIHASMVKAFRSLGLEVLDLSFPENEEDARALKSLARCTPTAIFTVDLPLGMSAKKSMRDFQSFIGIPWIIWFVDDPDGYGFSESCDPSWTIVFCWDREIVGTACSGGSWKGIEPMYLPLATDPEVFFPEGGGFPVSFPGGVFVGSTAHSNPFLDGAIRNCSDFDEDISGLWKRWKKCLGKAPQALAWGFLGEKTGIESGTLQQNPLARLWVQSAVHRLGQKKRKEIVCRVIGEGGGVFGDRGWEQPMGNLYLGEITYGEALRRVYLGSAFILDIRQPQSRTGTTQRVFDAGACGIPVLTDFSPEMESLFDLDRETYFFRTLEEAQEIKNLILLHPPAGREKGARARERVLALHTYRHRAREVLHALHRFFPCSLAYSSIP